MTYTEPLLSLVVLGFALWLWRYRRGPGRGWVWLGLIFVVLISWPPVDWLLARPLEARYPTTAFEAAPTDAIVVLAGGISPPQVGFPYERMNESTLARCEFGAWLFKKWGHVPMLVSGGPDRPGGKPFAVTLREYMVQAGVDPGLIWTEGDSRSTHENAVLSAKILRQHGVHRVALVVDRQSMRRAEACFRKEGFEVIPAPSDQRDLDFSDLKAELLPSWKSIRRNEITLHEMVGLLWYRWRGWI